MGATDDDRARRAPEELSDDELVALCLASRRADERPFAELFRRHRKVVWRVCSKYFRSPEDVGDRVQETFFRAYRALGRYSGGHPALFRAWLSTIAANGCKNELRRRSRRPQLSDEPLEPSAATVAADAETSLIQQSRQRLLRRALARLSPNQQEILRRADFEQMPYADIATELGLSLSAVKMRTVRARAALAAAYRDLEPHGETPRGKN